MQFLEYFLKNPIFAVTILVAILTVYFLVRYGAINAAKESNQILRDLNKDKDDKICELEGKIEAILKKLNYLEGVVATLSKQKSDYERIISKALKEHFDAFPELAIQLNQQIKRKK